MDANEILRLCSNTEEIKEFKKYLDRLADAMLLKFVDKLAKTGWVGWDDEDYTIKQIKADIQQHLEKDDPVDIANYALFWFAKVEEKP